MHLVLQSVMRPLCIPIVVARWLRTKNLARG
jgi:hypothetical protein